jgi:class 3 adenylate cyclase
MKADRTVLERYFGAEAAKRLAEGKSGQAEQQALAGQLARIYQAMLSYLPSGTRRHGTRLAAGKKVEQTILVADVTGFTAMSEKLSRIGKEGAEEVTNIINSYFSPLIKIALKYGGDVISFAGDAFTAGFEALPGEKSPHHLRALAAVREMQEFVKNFSEVKVSAGTFPLNLHLALHAGPVMLCRVGDPSRELEYLAAGSATQRAAEIEEHSGAGEALVSQELYKLVEKQVKAEPVPAARAHRLTSIDVKAEPVEERPPALPADIDAALDELEALRPCISPWLLSNIVADPQAGGFAGEHRRVTSLFLNLWGMDFDGDPQAVTKAQNYIQVLQQAVQKYEGSINKIDFSRHGPRVFVLFGAPAAHENDEERALLCALELLSREEFKFGGLKQRFGVNSGFVYAGTIGSPERREFTVMGDEVNLAARLMSIAEEGQLVISAAVNRKAGKKFEIKSLGEREFKGKSHPVAIFQATGEKQAEDDIFARWVSESKAMVGRENEKTVLNESVEKTISGKGQVVSIVGEPGIGKSRLSRELIQNWLERGYTVFGGNCQSYGSAISYLPWSELLKGYLGIKETDSLEDKESKIRKMLEIIDPQLAEWACLVGEVVGVPMPETDLTKSLDAKLRQQRLFDLVLDILSWGAQQEPLMLIIEDLHWADSASLGLLNYVARNIGEKPILLCLVYRPIEAKQEFATKDFHTGLSLKELSQEESQQLIHTLLAIEGMPKELEDLILKKSQGNPFFVEEVIKSLIEQKVITQEGGKWQVMVSDVKSVNIPDTVQGVIMSRVDRLSPSAKDVLQVASVIGREFEYPVLSAVYPKKMDLGPVLTDLNRFDLVLSEKESHYFFKHIMTQEVAYDSLPFNRRRDLHNHIGDYLEESFGEKVEEVMGLLAHHYYYASNWEPAFFYSVEAGDNARKVYANQEALAHYDRALEVFDKMVEAGMLPELTKRIQEELKAQEAATTLKDSGQAAAEEQKKEDGATPPA